MQYVSIEVVDSVLTVILAERDKEEGFILNVMRVVPGGEKDGFDPELETYEVGTRDMLVSGGVHSWSLDGYDLTFNLTSEAAAQLRIDEVIALELDVADAQLEELRPALELAFSPVGFSAPERDGRNGRARGPFEKRGISLYPDLDASGGVLPAIQAAVAAGGYDVGRIIGRSGDPFMAAIDTGNGNVAVGVLLNRRAFTVKILNDGIGVAGGSAPGIPDVLAVAAALRAGISGDELPKRFPFMHVWMPRNR